MISPRQSTLNVVINIPASMPDICRLQGDKYRKLGALDPGGYRCGILNFTMATSGLLRRYANLASEESIFDSNARNQGNRVTPTSHREFVLVYAQKAHRDIYFLKFTRYGVDPYSLTTQFTERMGGVHILSSGGMVSLSVVYAVGGPLYVKTMGSRKCEISEI